MGCVLSGLRRRPRMLPRFRALRIADPRERIDETTIRIDGTFPIDDFNEQFDVELEHEDYHTIAGFVFDLLGRAAEPGDEVRSDGLRFRVLETDGSRIQRLEVEFGLEPSAPEGDETEAA